MTSASRLSLAVAACWLLVLLPAVAQALSQTGDVIRRIVVEGNQRIEPSTVESYLAVRPGEPLRPAEGRRFAQEPVRDRPVRRRDASTAQGDVLVVKVVENPIINRIAFEGNKRLDDRGAGGARSSCGRAWSTPAPASRTPSAASSSSTAATAATPPRSSPRSSSSTRTGSIWCSRSTRARRTGVGGINFIGNEQFSDSTLRGVIQTTRERLVPLPDAPTTPTIPTG